MDQATICSDCGGRVEDDRKDSEICSACEIAAAKRMEAEAPPLPEVNETDAEAEEE